MIDWNNYKTVIIVGLSATGKSWLSRTLPVTFKVWHTDDYMHHDFDDALYVLMDDMARSSSVRKAVEGVQAYRLLRKLAERNMKQPDLIVRCVADSEVRRIRHKARETEVSKQFDNTLSKFWFDYLRLMKDRKKPMCIIYNTIKQEIIGIDKLEL